MSLIGVWRGWMDQAGGAGDGGRVSSAGRRRVTNSEKFPLPASLLPSSWCCWMEGMLND